jgi:hypothetical protein
MHFGNMKYLQIIKCYDDIKYSVNRNTIDNPDVSFFTFRIGVAISRLEGFRCYVSIRKTEKNINLHIDQHVLNLLVKKHHEPFERIHIAFCRSSPVTISLSTIMTIITNSNGGRGEVDEFYFAIYDEKDPMAVTFEFSTHKYFSHDLINDAESCIVINNAWNVLNVTDESLIELFALVISLQDIDIFNVQVSSELLKIIVKNNPTCKTFGTDSYFCDSDQELIKLWLNN